MLKNVSRIIKSLLEIYSNLILALPEKFSFRTTPLTLFFLLLLTANILNIIIYFFISFKNNRITRQLMENVILEVLLKTMNIISLKETTCFKYKLPTLKHLEVRKICTNDNKHYIWKWNIKHLNKTRKIYLFYKKKCSMQFLFSR